MHSIIHYYRKNTIFNCSTYFNDIISNITHNVRIHFWKNLDRSRFNCSIFISNFLIQFPVSTLSNILSLKEFVKRSTAWKILYFSSSLILYLLTITLNIDFYLFLKLYVIHEYCLYLIYMILIIKSVKQMDKEL